MISIIKNSKINTKRPLFFDRSKITFIEFDLEKVKTCKEIYEELKIEINKKINEIYRNLPKGINFNFIMTYSRLNNKFDNLALIEIKIDMSYIITELMQTNQYNLFYLPEINNDIKRDLKLKLKEKDVNKKASFGDNNINNNTKKLQLEKYLNNEGVYYFDKKIAQFIYGKGFIDEEKVIINIKKSNIEILINEIKKDNYFENEIPLSLQVFETKCPNYIFELRQNNTTHILGLYKQKSFLLWKNAINLAKIKNQDIQINKYINNEIKKNNINFYTNCHSVPSKCMIISQILENPEKRKIFLEELEDKKISDIASNIFLYKIHLKKKEYIGALACLKQISFYINYNNIENEKLREVEIKKYKNIFTNEIIEHYKSILKKVNDIFTKNLNTNGENINNIFKEIFKEDLFDNLYFQIYDLYFLPFFNKLKKTLKKEYNHNEKPIIIKKFHLLLSKYTFKYFNMKENNNFNLLCVENKNIFDLSDIPEKNIINTNSDYNDSIKNVIESQ